jgi:hypothetical protein
VRCWNVSRELVGRLLLGTFAPRIAETGTVFGVAGAQTVRNALEGVHLQPLTTPKRGHCTRVRQRLHRLAISVLIEEARLDLADPLCSGWRTERALPQHSRRDRRSRFFKW